MNAPDINTIRQHPAYRAIADIADALTEITEARRNLALLELKVRKQIPECLNAYFDAVGSDADKRIDLGDGKELVIDDEWWESSNPVTAVRLTKTPRSLEEIAASAISAATQNPQA